MKLSLNFKDDAATGESMNCQATFEFELDVEKALTVLGRLQEANVPGLILAALAQKEYPKDEE